MSVQELWSPENEEQLQTLIQGMRTQKLAPALLALEGSSDDDAKWCLQTLEEWGGFIDARIDESTSAGEQVDVMTTVLVEELGLRGDHDDYYNPSNSFLGGAMRRRRGLPILLSAIWILVGERSGVEVEGVGLPCHFIARIGGEHGIYVDPFASGRVLKRKDCKKMVENLSQGRIPWKERYLKPISVEMLIERVLHNLINSYNMSGDRVMLYRVVRMLAELRPNVANFQFMHARAAEEVGATKLAAKTYTTILEQFPSSEEATRSTIRLGPLHGRIRQMN